MGHVRIDGSFGVVLDGSGLSEADIGSKAASLDRLIGAGFRVPETAVVTTAAYRSFIAGSGLGELTEGIASRPVPPAALGEDRRREIDDAFIAAPMPDDVFETLCRLHSSLPAGGGLAVRSSAEAEDLEDASFAGQYLSILGVEGVDEMVEAVRRVWASLWYPWASAYRRRMNVAEEDLAMAVILQRLVPAQRSGVVFTRDPNHPRLVRLEVVEGFGEQLVSGEVTPEVHQLRRPSLQPLEATEVDLALREAAHAALRIEERFSQPTASGCSRRGRSRRSPPPRAAATGSIPTAYAASGMWRPASPRCCRG
jgi:pyruvate,water dikinase